MSGASRERFAAAVRREPVDLGLACLLIATETDPELDTGRWLTVLDELAAPLAGCAPDTPAAQAAGLLHADLGRRHGFAGGPDVYEDVVRSSLLPEVLRRRRGLPILLSVVWLEVARRAGIPAYGVGLPGHFVVAIGRPDGDHVLCDPFGGGRLLDRTDAAALVATTAGGALRDEHLRPWSGPEILLRVLANVRVAARGGSLEDARTRLWATELSLLLPAHPLDLRRERGELMVRLGDYLGGAAELAAYADLVEPADTELAGRARAAARMARARCN